MEREEGGERESERSGDHQLAALTLSRSPKRSSPSRVGTSGARASSVPAPNRVVTTTAIATSGLTPRSRGPARRTRRHQQAPGSTDRKRDPDQGGDHQPREHRVRHRLGGVALAIEHDPHAERPADDSEDDDLSQRPLADAEAEGIGERLEHQWEWCWTTTACSPPGRVTSSLP